MAKPALQTWQRCVFLARCKVAPSASYRGIVCIPVSCGALMPELEQTSYHKCCICENLILTDGSSALGVVDKRVMSSVRSERCVVCWLFSRQHEELGFVDEIASFRSTTPTRSIRMQCPHTPLYERTSDSIYKSSGPPSEKQS